MKQIMKTSFLIFSFGLLAGKLNAQDAIFIKKIGVKGSPILFLPHIGCDASMWQSIAENYAQTNTCYLFDFAGFAGKPALKGNYTENYVSSLVKFITDNNLKECILIGQNYGAFVATKVAEKLPASVKFLVLTDFFPKLSMVLGKNLSQEKLDNILASIKQNILETDSLSFATYQRQMATGMNYMDSSFVPEFVYWQMKSDRQTLSGTLIEQMSADLLPYFEKNKIPTLVFSTWYFAKSFKKMPMSDAEETLSGMYPQAKNVQHAITENAKDFIACDQPVWFTAQLDQFLKQKRGAK
ncbi:MAG: alpha/beta hydrolase [Ginsengibacter sp.]